MMLPLWLAWSLNVPLLIGVMMIVWRRTARGTAAAWWFWAALAARLGGGLALGTYYITQLEDMTQPGGDTFTLYRHALRFTHWAPTDWSGYARLLLTAIDQPGAPHRWYATFSNSYFFVRLLSLLNFLTGGDYCLNSLWLSATAFIGSWLMARELWRVVPSVFWGAWLGALAWPSGLFWMSGVSKDAVLLAAFGTFTAAALRLLYPIVGIRRHDGRWLLALLVSSFLLWKIKFFIAAAVFVAFGALALTVYFGPRLRRRWPRLRTWQLLMLAACALAPLARVAHEGFGAEYLLIHIPRNQAALRGHDATQPELRLALKPSILSFVANAPAAALGVFTRPWLGEGKGLRWRASGLENAVLLLLFGWAVVGWWRRGHPINLPPLAGALLLIVLLVAVMFGLTTPNLGTLFRYRSVLLPFSLFLVDWLRVGSSGAIWSPSDSRGRSNRLSGFPSDSAASHA
jgi:hypothetical protein